VQPPDHNPSAFDAPAVVAIQPSELGVVQPPDHNPSAFDAPAVVAIQPSELGVVQPPDHNSSAFVHVHFVDFGNHHHYSATAEPVWPETLVQVIPAS